MVVAFVNESDTGRRFLNLQSARNSVNSTVKFGRDSIISNVSVSDQGDDIFLKLNLNEE